MYKIFIFLVNLKQLTKFVSDNAINPFICEYNRHDSSQILSIIVLSYAYGHKDSGSAMTICAVLHGCA